MSFAEFWNLMLLAWFASIPFDIYLNTKKNKFDPELLETNNFLLFNNAMKSKSDDALVGIITFHSTVKKGWIK